MLTTRQMTRVAIIKTLNKTFGAHSTNYSLRKIGGSQVLVFVELCAFLCFTLNWPKLWVQKPRGKVYE
jgi:hypothetical protein